jgi:acetyl esterase
MTTHLFTRLWFIIDDHTPCEILCLDTSRRGEIVMAQPHPQLASITAMLRERGLAPADPLTTPLDDVRAANIRYHAVWNQRLPQVDQVLDLFISVGTRKVPLRLFYPDQRRDNVPVLVYFHGGGFVLNNVETHDRLLRLLAVRAGVAVVAVSYGLAPEHRFPHQLEDALAALAWLRSRGEALGLDGTRVALGGDSAGANLALATQVWLRQHRQPQALFGLLLYGMFSANLDTQSHRRFGGGAFGLTTARVDWFWEQYLAEPGQRRDPLAAPLHAELHGLPPQLVIGAGLDCLLDDSVALADRLDRAGVPNTLSVVAGVPHSFMQMSAFLDPADRAVSEAAAAVAAHLSRAETPQAKAVGWA